MAEEQSEDRGKAKLRVSVLDLGSTSFHLLVSDASATQGLTRVARHREQLRLGAFIASSGHIPDDVCERAIATAREMRKTSDAFEPDRIVAVATAALRDADNGRELSARLGAEIGVPVRLLSGEEEARLIFAAFRHRLPLGKTVSLGADLGGGSLELALGNDADISWEATLRLGVARLHGEIVSSDPMTKRERKEIRRRVRELLAPHVETIAASGTERCIGSGGTMRALARLLTAGPDAKERWASEGPSIRIKRRQIGRLAETLVESTHDERLAMPGIKRSRADLLPTGAAILNTLLETCEMRNVVACDWGLREGVVLETIGLASASGR